MVINAIHVTAVTATGIEKRPKWKGPLLKSCLFRTRNKIGIPSIQANIGSLNTVIIETYHMICIILWSRSTSLLQKRQNFQD